MGNITSFKYIPFFFLFVVFCAIRPIEYVYPVALINQPDNERLLLIQQKGLNNINMWFWDIKSEQLEPGLCSRFNPAGLRILPDKSGFSFIDNGLVKIKYFHKRSPKTIQFDEPLYNISLIEWIDNYYFYTSAKRYDYYGIFQLTIEGDVCCIVDNQIGDCLYPQKIDDILFYIERVKNNYRIMSITYSSDNMDSDIKRKSEQELIFDFKKQPIAFLHMISPIEGFILEYDAYIDKKDDTILFSYLHLVKSNEVWHHTQLFSFEIPAVFLMKDSPVRLYESILPLLPRHEEKKIYFVHLFDKYLNVFCYNLLLGLIEKRTFVKRENRHSFVPFVEGKKLFFGGVTALNSLYFDF